MTISACFTIDGSPTGIDATTGQMVGVAVAPGATVTFQIVDTTNLERVTWEVIGKSANFTAPTIAVSGTPSGSTATCAAENTAGIACGIRARGVGPYGTRTLYEGKFYTAGAGDFEPFYEGETGWAYKVNAQLNTIFGAI